MKSNLVSYLCLFIVVVSTFSCQNRPKEVLNRKQMERVLYDVYVAEAIMETDYQHFNTPEKKEAYINEVFRIHHITQAQWDTSLSWYSDRIDLYLKMNDSVKSMLQRARIDIDTRLSAQQAQQYTDPSLFQPSYIPKTFAFSMPSPRNGFRFQLDSTDIGEKITDDHFTFTFSVIGIPPAYHPRFSSLLALHYADTTLYQRLDITENKTYSMAGSKFIENDTLSQIQGFLHLQDTTILGLQIRLYNIFLGNKELAQDTVLQLQDNSGEREQLLLKEPIRMNDSDSL
ncbi:MAG: hypothetical protein A2W86_09820 [Bacteroidetes bacterium GWD2_45_23]|nr:MAG: hypothetical protein A2W87_05705 [Bacteroidetes bacterium GWC2_46_850]OFX69869.1 MAG: hypothetical protein A2071_09135 [Bacteroidetes bacterium GWC1_47_7]OFX83725.1 MAG: hypothetical protein A2W86_09820 [Bacteroidetes bacterium GWD2_45_23]HBA99488.1 hypothetical protein [Porphyromonadaceae bacterium]HCC18532.1 hypothetical protein [Porphyromonadaceae bacterium]